MSNQPPLADRFPNRPRPSRAGRLKALGLAILVHLGLLAMLVVGVSWKSSVVVAPTPPAARTWGTSRAPGCCAAGWTTTGCGPGATTASSRRPGP